MSSSNQFSHGLNNWAASDKPMRSDFVQDNETLEQGALWKTEYDPDGRVLTAGGISGYAMAQSDYDPQGTVAGTAGGISGYAMAKSAYDADGSIAQQGGIAAAVESAVRNMGGFTLCEYGKNGTVHQLIGTGSNLRFEATEPFAAGDTVQLNGVQMSLRIQGCGGALPQNYWRAGDTVICTAQGTTLTFYALGQGLPRSGGTFTGNVKAASNNRSGGFLRNIEVKANDEKTYVSTDLILFIRK